MAPCIGGNALFGLQEDEVIFREALAAFPPDGPASDQSMRRSQVEAIDYSFFNEPDRRFYEGPAQAPSTGIHEYINAHAEEFFWPGN